MDAGREVQMEGMYVHRWLIHFIVLQKLAQHCNYTPVKKYIKASGIPLRNQLDKEAGVQKD